MKRFALILVAIALFLTVGSSTGWAQRSGSMQATAHVVDTRAAVTSLESAQNLAGRWSADPGMSRAVETRYAQVSLRRTLSAEGARPDAVPPKSQLVIRVEYLRN